MRRVLLTFAIVFMIAIAGSAFAQTTPYFQVYFDEDLKVAAEDCPPDPAGTVFDTLYIVAHNFDMWISAAEFAVDYGPHLSHWGERPVDTDLALGGTTGPNGVALSWPVPRSGWSAVLMMTVTVRWECSGCGGINDAEIVITGIPGHPNPRAVDFNTEESVYGVGMKSLICASVPVEETSWGQIKALYH